MHKRKTTIYSGAYDFAQAMKAMNEYSERMQEVLNNLNTALDDLGVTTDDTLETLREHRVWVESMNEEDGKVMKPIPKLRSDSTPEEDFNAYFDPED